MKIKPNKQPDTTKHWLENSCQPKAFRWRLLTGCGKMRPWRYISTRPARPSQRKEDRGSQGDIGESMLFSTLFLHLPSHCPPRPGERGPQPKLRTSLPPRWKSRTKWRAWRIRGQNPLRSVEKRSRPQRQEEPAHQATAWISPKYSQELLQQVPGTWHPPAPRGP